MAYSLTQWEKTKTLFESGQFSLSQIQGKTGISKSKISERAKREQWERGKNADYIEAKKTIAITKGNEKGTVIDLLDDIADEKISHLRIINNNATKLADKLNQMADIIESPSDLRTLVEANDKLAITLKVADRHAPKSDTNIQNNIAQGIKIIDA